MGINGFFNYSAPGPGVSKNAPQKRAFAVFFETWFRNVWNMMSSGFVYIIFSILLIPSGLGSVGMTHVARNIARGKHSFGLSDFFETIKKNWKQALPIGILNVLVTAGLIFAVYFYSAFGNTAGMVALGFAISIFFVFSVMKHYVWLIIITFNMPVKKVFKNAFFFVFINMKNNLLIGLGTILWIGIVAGILMLCATNNSVFVFVAVFLALLSIMFYPSFKHLLVQFCIFPSVRKHMIDPYYEQHPDEDIEKRRNLGLVVSEDDEEETVFNDERLLRQSSDDQDDDE